MKLREEDWISIPYDESLSSSGAHLACRALAHDDPANWPPPVSRLHEACAGFAAELALRRWFERQMVPHRLLQDKPLTRPWHPGILLGGRRLDLQCMLLFRRAQIRQLKRNPSRLLDAHAHIPLRTLSAPVMDEGDLVVVAVLVGLTARSPYDIQKASASRLPMHLISTAPDATWMSKSRRSYLGPITVSCQDPQPFNLELAGQNTARQWQTETLTLIQGSATSSLKFRAVYYVHTDHLPSTPLLLKGAALDKRWITPTRDWKNLWIYGMDVIFVGWLTKGAFMQQAQRMPAGTRMRFGERMQHESLVLAFHKLRPMNRLITITRHG